MDNIKKNLSTFTDPRDGTVYKTVTIGRQTWLAENLKASVFRNGDPIPHMQSHDEWDNAGRDGKPAWCFYNKDSANDKKYGRLYNWFALADPRGLAPEGWHFPSESEWNELFDILGGPDKAGTKMKSAEGWTHNGNGSDSSCFSALPCGCRMGDGDFSDFGFFGYWWSTTEDEHECAWHFELYYGSGRALDNHDFKRTGFSVRCVFDEQKDKPVKI